MTYTTHSGITTQRMMMMNFKINNKTGSPVKYEKEIHSLCDFAQRRLGFEKPPSIFLNHDKRNAANTLGKTGHYDPNTMEIHVFATGRHPKDILRSIAHELVHHNQHMNGELDMHGYSGKGYAQKNPKLRKAEMEANDPMLFRDWEDSLKEKENTIYNERRNRKMSLKEWKNKEIGGLLTSKWGFKMDLSKLSEVENKEKADLNKDGKLSDYEEARGKAIEKSMAEKKPEGEEEPDKPKRRDRFVKKNRGEKPEKEKEEEPDKPKRRDRFDKKKSDEEEKEKPMKENEGDSENKGGGEEPAEEGAGEKPKKKGKKMSKKQLKYFGKKKGKK